MLKLGPVDDKQVVEITASGSLSREDYEELVPQLEQLLAKHGVLRFLIRLRDLSGVAPGAIWEDLKFDYRHQHQFGKTAVIGDKKWEEWGTRISAPFFAPEVRFFYPDQEEEARAWVHSD